MTAMARPEDDDNSAPHHQLAVATTVAAAATVTTGFLYQYGDDLNDKETVHMTLGIVATAAFASTFVLAPDDAHAAAGILRGVAVGVAIMIVWD